LRTTRGLGKEVPNHFELGVCRLGINSKKGKKTKKRELTRPTGSKKGIRKEKSEAAKRETKKEIVVYGGNIFKPAEKGCEKRKKC